MSDKKTTRPIINLLLLLPFYAFIAFVVIRALITKPEARSGVFLIGMASGIGLCGICNLVLSAIRQRDC